MMHSKTPFLLTAVAGLGLAGGTHAGILTWTGLGDSVSAYQEANWDLDGLGAPSDGTVDPNVPINHDVILAGGAGNPGGGGGISGAFTLGEFGSLSISDNNFFAGFSGVRRDDLVGTFEDDNRPLTMTGTGMAQFQFLGEIDATLDGTASLVLNGGGNPINNSSIDLLGADVTLTFNAELPADVIAEHLAKLFVGGSAAVIGADPAVAEPGDNLLIVSDGGTGAIVTPLLAAPIPGDADGDGDIDDTDLGISISNFTGPVGAAGGKTAADGDTDGDGDVDDTDLGVAISGFTGPLSPAAVPEPASFALLSLGGLLIARRRRA